MTQRVPKVTPPGKPVFIDGKFAYRRRAVPVAAKAQPATQTANRHPADRLADVRAEIRALEDEEHSLKAHILATGAFKGSEYMAQVSEQNRSTLDREKLEATFGKAAVAACTRSSKVTIVRVAKLA